MSTNQILGSQNIHIFPTLNPWEIPEDPWNSMCGCWLLVEWGGFFLWPSWNPNWGLFVFKQQVTCALLWLCYNGYSICACAAYTDNNFTHAQLQWTLGTEQSIERIRCENKNKRVAASQGATVGLTHLAVIERNVKQWQVYSCEDL